MKTFEKKTREAHSGFYLTLISMMQSLALGYLLQIVGVELTEHGTISWNMLFQVLVVLLCIVIVWHEYAIGTVLYRWRLDIVDSVIPFLFGITEYFIIASIAMPETNIYFGNIKYSLWLWSMVGFAITSMIAYIHQEIKAEVENSMKPLLAVPKTNRQHAQLITIISFMVAVLYRYYPLNKMHEWILSVILLAIMSYEVFRLNKIYINTAIPPNFPTSV